MKQSLTEVQYNELRRRGEELTIRAAQLVTFVAAHHNLALTIEAGILHADIADYAALVTGEAWLTLIHPANQSAQIPAAPDCAQVDEAKSDT